MKKKKEAIVVATRYKKRAMKVNYYTREGDPLSKECVEKEKTNSGIKVYYFE